MFCPYVVKTCIKAVVIGYDEENIEKGSIVSEQFIHEDCHKEQCGAWCEGRCTYNER